MPWHRSQRYLRSSRPRAARSASFSAMALRRSASMVLLRANFGKPRIIPGMDGALADWRSGGSGTWHGSGLLAGAWSNRKAVSRPRPLLQHTRTASVSRPASGQRSVGAGLPAMRSARKPPSYRGQGRSYMGTALAQERPWPRCVQAQTASKCSSINCTLATPLYSLTPRRKAAWIWAAAPSAWLKRIAS